MNRLPKLTTIAGIVAAVLCIGTACGNASSRSASSSAANTNMPSSAAAQADSATVYVTRDLSPEALVRIYEAVGRKAG